MQEYEVCMHRYRRLIELLEDDYREIVQALGGDVLNVYRDILEREKEVLENGYKLIYRQF